MPSQPFSPLAAILGQTRALLGTPGLTGSDLMPVLKQVLAFHASEQGDAEHKRRLESELAYTLAAVIDETNDSAVVKLCLGTLFGLGVLGGILAMSFMDKNRLSREAFANLMARFPAHQRLMVVNRFFQVPRKCEPRDLAWGFGTVKDIQGQDPEEALLFLERCADFGEQVAFAVQRELLRGQFGLWLEELLKMGLNPEQVRYMARTCGRLSSDALAAKLGRHLKGADEDTKKALLDAFSRCGTKGNDKVIKAAALFLRHKSASIRMAACEALLRLSSPAIVDALAVLLAKAAPSDSDLADQLHGLLFRLDAARFEALLTKLDKRSRVTAPLAMVWAVAGLDPEGAAQVAGELAAGAGGGNAAAAKALVALVAARKGTAPGPAWKPPKYKRAVPKADEGDDGGFFTKLADKVLSRDDETVEPPRAEGGDFLLAPAKGQKVAGSSAKHVEAVGLTYEGGAYSKLRLAASVFTGCLFKGPAFTGCRFSGVDFGGCDLQQAEFADCEFVNCSFAGARLAKCAFLNCRLRTTHFAAARLEQCRWDGTWAQECDFWGARMDKPEVRAACFTACHFAYAALHGGRMEGVEFQDCRFESTFIQAATIRNAGAQACSFQDSRFLDLDTDEPAFLLQESESRCAALAALALGAKPPKPPAELASSFGLTLMHQFLERFLFAWTMKRRAGIALAANRRRLQWCASKLGPEGGEFLKMLPALVEAPVMPEGKKAWQPAQSCSITGYEPDLTTRGLLDKYLDAEVWAKGRDKAGPPVVIEAFYTIGSVGTIAQSKGSDIDMWLCYDESGAKPPDLAAMRAKLDALETWADARFGLEIHFFSMDMQKTRDNDFGFSDKESAGSTQALLLKEEFYRTAVLLAGGKLAWWFFAPGATAKSYAEGLERLATLPACYDAVDLGHLGEIPKEEFFGASLWQIVKALKSPFKSVMKFALLDKYIVSPEAQPLLCDHIKDNLLQGRDDFWSVDPYAVLFGEVYTHYKAAKDETGRRLMRLAFEEKTGFNPLARTSGKPFELSGISYQEWFFPHNTSGLESELSTCTGGSAGCGAASFAQQMALGDQVSSFMFAAYSRIQKLISTSGASAMVTKEDMTKMGRKIFGYFKPRKHKIMHIPFVASPRDMFSALDIACEGLPGTPMDWIVSGEMARKQGKKTVNEEIRRSKAPVSLMAWLAANQIYVPGRMVNGSNLQAPVSVPDVTELMDVLVEFFPPRQIFDTPIEDSLKAEEACRALIVLNFLAAREERTLRDVHLIYCTNWGELFCVSKPEGVERLVKSPRRFVQENVTGIIGHKLEIEVHAPRRSLAPRITIE